jgi:cytochrome P450
MALVSDLDLPIVDIFSPDLEGRIHTVLHDLRTAGHWLIRTSFGVAVIDHDAVRGLLRDPRLHPLGAQLFEMQGITSGPAYDRFARSILNLEGEEHTRLRRLVSRAFTPRAADRLRPSMRAWVDTRAQAMAERGGGDFVADLAEAYPIAMICELVGAPEEDWPRFSTWASDVFRIFNMNLAEDLPTIQAAQDAMRDYVAALIEARRDGEPRQDLLSELLRIEEEGDQLSYEELCDLVITLILAGTDTTRNQLGLAVMVLARHPGEWERLVADPDLVPRAVEEILRYEPTAAATPRLTVEDLTYRDATIPAGTFVALMTSAANRDPDRVECPMDVDVGLDRETWSPLTFGNGPHYCLGAALARAELQEALGVLVRRWRRFELAGEPAMKPFVGLYGPISLPLRIEGR